MDTTLRKLLIISLIIAFLLGFFVGFGFSYLKEKKCQKNPFSFGINQIEGNMELTCNCFFDDPSYSPFFVNKTGIFVTGAYVRELNNYGN